MNSVSTATSVPVAFWYDRGSGGIAVYLMYTWIVVHCQLRVHRLAQVRRY